MLALRLGDDGLDVRACEAPALHPGEALVRVRLAGFCSTDAALAQGYAGFRGTLGHELVGVVEACDDGAWVGRRVVAEINVGCGRCGECARGDARHCPRRTALGIRGRDGCFAEYVAVPAANLHPVPDAVPDEAAVFTEPLAAALEVLEQVPIAPSHRVAVLGDGKLGLLVALALRGTHCELALAGRHPRKRAVAERAGVRTTDPAGLAPGYDVVVEATGSPAGLATALDLVRPRGTVVLKTTHRAPLAVDVARVVVDEVRLVGSRCGPFAPALRALAEGRVDPTPLVDATYPLREGVAAFAHATRPGTLKVLLAPGA